MADENHSDLMYWLGTTARRIREERSKLSPEQLAPLVGVNNTTVRRFERGESQPREIDRLLAAYAFLGGYKDARDLVDEALRLWRKEGSAPEQPLILRKMLDLMNDLE